MRNRTAGNSPRAPGPAQQSPTTDLKRRRFLLTLGAGGAGVAIAAANALPGTAVAQSLDVPSADNESAYRETDHVRDYYRTAKI